MRRALIILGLTLMLPLGGATAEASTPAAAVSTLVASARQRLDIWQAARHDLARTRARHGELAGRITALKRKNPPGGELQRLLRASLAAEHQLEAALSQVGRARADVERTVRGSVGRIDQEIRNLVPKLKTGSLTDRRAAARRINQLRDDRKALRNTLAALKDARATPRRDWSKYQVQVEPLDGPSELDEKADFVEDTRDKLGQKRQALASLLREARQEQQIARAARDFDTYVRIFDEEARSDRVTRQPNSRGAVVQTSATDTPSAGAGTDSQSESFSGGRGTEVPNAASPPQSVGNSVDPNLNTGTDGPGTALSDDGSGTKNGVQSPTVVAPEASAPSVARDINADLLLNLRVSDLEGQDLDLATLQRLIAELEDLDGFLAAQAASIRQRARTIEADEARDLNR